MSPRIATATVTLTVKINVEGSWNETSTCAQVRDQASLSAVGALKRALRDGKISAIIEGEPRVTMVTSEIA